MSTTYLRKKIIHPIQTRHSFFFGFLGGKSIDPENPRTTNWFPPGRPEPSNRACVQREESTWVLGLCELHIKKSQVWILVCPVRFYALISFCHLFGPALFGSALFNLIDIKIAKDIYLQMWKVFNIWCEKRFPILVG